MRVNPAIDDPSKCYGVTSGGAPEVVIAPTNLSACTILRKING